MRGIPALCTLAALLLLAGCPLPQPLPDYPKGQPVTPPRIIVDDTVRAVTYPETVVRVPAGCAVKPSYVLGAQLRDATANGFFARWFVNYDPTNQPSFTGAQKNTIPATDASPSDPTLYDLPRFSFPPAQYDPIPGTGGEQRDTAGAVHVVELVVSNGFDTDADRTVPPLAALPYRTPGQGYEVQIYRWVFVTVPQSLDVTCPPP